MDLSQATTHHGEILGININQSTVNSTPTCNHAVTHVFLFFQSKGMGAVNNKGIGLAEGAFIE